MVQARAPGTASAHQRATSTVGPVSDGPTADRSTLLDLQRLLLPPTLPPLGCTEAAAHYRAHNDDLRIGGDWYDLIDRNDNRVVSIVGDVVGHGVRQISVMGQLRAASNALARTLPDPADVLRVLDAFAAEVPGAEYTSVSVLMLDGTTTARIASAGHPPMLHVKAAGGYALIEGGRGPLLTLPGARASSAFAYAIDDIFVQYTDGLVERRGRDVDSVLADIADFVASSAEISCSRITADLVDRFADEADDDIAVIVLRPRNHRSPDYLLQPQLAPEATFS
jgi:serine phosphatase RsbU (regulator of sigma subunit)